MSTFVSDNVCKRVKAPKYDRNQLTRTGGCFNLFCNVQLCVRVCLVMCGCFDNYVGVLAICVLKFTVLCIICTVFLYCFVYIYLMLISFVCTSVRTTATG